MQPEPHEQIRIEAVQDETQRLVVDVLAKDRKATAEFVARCADWIYPFVRRRLTPNTEAIDDLVQEVLLAAWQNLTNFRGESDLRAWVLGIARHKVEDHYRKHIRVAEFEQNEDCAFEPLVLPTVDEQLDSDAQGQKVASVLAALPEAYGLALLWRYRDGRSTREMAQVMGKTEKAIERLLARARGSFKQRWLNVGR